MIFRMTGDDLMPGSTTLDEVLAFAAALAEHVDALNIGVGLARVTAADGAGGGAGGRVLPPGAGDQGGVSASCP